MFTKRLRAPLMDKKTQLMQEIVDLNLSEAEFASFFTEVLSQAMPRYHSRIFWGDRMMTLEKSAGFLDDPRFLKAYKHIRGSHIYDAYDSPHTIAWRLHTLVWAAERAVELEGDFVECGVFKGD